MNQNSFANITDIEELLIFYDSLINEGHIITLINIKNTLKLSTDLSQKFLQYYFDQRKEQLYATYLIEGYSSHKNEYICAVLSETELLSLKDIKNYLVKIYSIQSKLNKKDASFLWRHELNTLNKLCNKIDFKKKLFIPEFSDIVLHDLKIKKEKNAIDKSNDTTPIKIKKEKISDEERQLNLYQTDKDKQKTKQKVLTQTIIETTKDRKIQDFTHVFKRKLSNDTPNEINNKLTKSYNATDNKLLNKHENTSNDTKNEIDNEKEQTENEKKKKITEVITESLKSRTPSKLFYSDSNGKRESEEAKKIKERKQTDDTQKKKNLIEEVTEPLTKINTREQTKETHMFFENGYLVTMEKNSDTYINETNSPSKTKTMGNTLLASPHKKRKCTQQTLLTNFFKKKK